MSTSDEPVLSEQLRKWMLAPDVVKMVDDEVEAAWKKFTNLFETEKNGISYEDARDAATTDKFYDFRLFLLVREEYSTKIYYYKKAYLKKFREEFEEHLDNLEEVIAIPARRQRVTVILIHVYFIFILFSGLISLYSPVNVISVRILGVLSAFLTFFFGWNLVIWQKATQTTLNMYEKLSTISKFKIPRATLWTDSNHLRLRTYQLFAIDPRLTRTFKYLVLFYVLTVMIIYFLNLRWKYPLEDSFSEIDLNIYLSVLFPFIVILRSVDCCANQSSHYRKIVIDYFEQFAKRRREIPDSEEDTETDEDEEDEEEDEDEEEEDSEADSESESEYEPESESETDTNSDYGSGSGSGSES
ncbi:hypothetical protein GCK72_017435 [Caenorhabditis remanei]|uniref:Uncharacterized protein n=1 Tax=Caenorhabditis remanei TaxID=31234 RepID=A0A6A5G8H2_CAERE|nr:hypothetical protein GCK72_017435 [Caenorhabditis remanei]KAF1750884.1 hypothetical protein GCK72_017435 [Caenorhabditis remanei]